MLSSFYYFVRASWYLTMGKYTNPEEYKAHCVAWDMLFNDKHPELKESVKSEHPNLQI